jgi:protein-disulfide isomerase
MKYSNFAIAAFLSFFIAACTGPANSLKEPENTGSGIVADEDFDIGTFSSDDPFLGKENAPLKMVIFSDFQCPFCKQYADYLDELEGEWISSGKLQVQFRDFPLAKHKNSLSAHMAAAAAHAQDRYLDMHRQLFDTQADWISSERPEEFFAQAAELLGLDKDQFQKDYNNPNAISEIKDDRDTGRAWGLTGVPTFYLNGEMYQGALSKEALVTVLENGMTNL